MGGLCSKEKYSADPAGGGGGGGGGGNFRGTGNTIADFNARQVPSTAGTPTTATRASVPAAVSGGTGAQGKTLGASTTPSSGVGGEGGVENARSAAALAAQARAAKPTGTDKLSQNLAAQKKSGMKGALTDASQENRRARESDAAASMRAYN